MKPYYSLSDFPDRKKGIYNSRMGKLDIRNN